MSWYKRRDYPFVVLLNQGRGARGEVDQDVETEEQARVDVERVDLAPDFELQQALAVEDDQGLE